jgi:hypothetical protein
MAAALLLSHDIYHNTQGVALVNEWENQLRVTDEPAEFER